MGAHQRDRYYIMDVLKDLLALTCLYMHMENFQSISRIFGKRAERFLPNVFFTFIYFLNFYLFTSHFSSVCWNEKFSVCLKRSVYFLIVSFFFACVAFPPLLISHLSLNTKNFSCLFSDKYFLNSTLFIFLFYLILTHHIHYLMQE